MFVDQFPIRNVHKSVSLTVHIEPWGEQHVVPPKATIEVVFFGRTHGVPSIDWRDSNIFVHGWCESQFFVLIDGAPFEQESLKSMITRLAIDDGIDPGDLQIDSEVLEFSQFQLDKAIKWNESGQEAARMAISKIGSCIVGHEQLWKNFCDRVLQSRGVFLPDDEQLWDELRDSSVDVGDGNSAEFYEFLKAKIANQATSVIR